MKKGDKLICIKDFEEYFKKGQIYYIDDVISFQDKILHVIVKYPLTEYQTGRRLRVKLEFLPESYIDNRISFYVGKKYNINSNVKFEDFFSHRKDKLKKLMNGR